MSIFEVTRKVRSENKLDYDSVKKAIKNSLGKNLNYNVLSETDNSITVSGSEKGAPYKFEATFNIEIDGEKAKISVDGIHKMTGVFAAGLIGCVVFCWMLLPLVALVIGLVRLNSHKNMYANKVEEILNNVSTNLAW